MDSIILVTPSHQQNSPLVYNLGNHQLIIANSYESPEAFELAAPVIQEGAETDGISTPQTVILDHEEAYYLYQCLTVLFKETRQ